MSQFPQLIRQGGASWPSKACYQYPDHQNSPTAEPSSRTGSKPSAYVVFTCEPLNAARLRTLSALIYGLPFWFRCMATAWIFTSTYPAISTKTLGSNCRVDEGLSKHRMEECWRAARIVALCTA